MYTYIHILSSLNPYPKPTHTTTIPQALTPKKTNQPQPRHPLRAPRAGAQPQPEPGPVPPLQLRGHPPQPCLPGQSVAGLGPRFVVVFGFLGGRKYGYVTIVYIHTSSPRSPLPHLPTNESKTPNRPSASTSTRPSGSSTSSPPSSAASPSSTTSSPQPPLSPPHNHTNNPTPPPPPPSPPLQPPGPPPPSPNIRSTSPLPPHQ